MIGMLNLLVIVECTADTLYKEVTNFHQVGIHIEILTTDEILYGAQKMVKQPLWAHRCRNYLARGGIHKCQFAEYLEILVKR